MVHHACQGFVPAGLTKTGVRPQQRREEPVGMVVLQIALHPFGAELALVDRELLPGLEANHFFIAHPELDAALHPTKAAVSFD